MKLFLLYLLEPALRSLAVGCLAALVLTVLPVKRAVARLHVWAGRQQSAIGRQQSELGKKQSELGRQQSELGRQQAEIARQASRELRRMFDDAITKGIAKPE